jgi:ABC-type transporter Mla subunit MlaD
MVLRRLLGAVILLIALLGIGLSAAGTVYGHRIIDDTATGLSASLDLASQSLNTAKDTLLLAKATLSQVNDGLDRVGITVMDVSRTISQTRPLLGEITEIVSHDVPDGVEAFQATVPDLARTAATVDATLAGLNDLRLEQRILGVPIRLELNLDYAPEVSFEESISRIGYSLEGITPRLRGLGARVDATSDSLEAIHQDLEATSSDLDRINRSVADAAPLLDEYVRIVTEVNDLIEHTRASVSRQLDVAKLVVTVAMVWVGLAQIAPLHRGWELLTGRRSDR